MRRLVILFTSLAVAPAGILAAGDERKPWPTSDDPAAVIESLKLGAKLETDDDGRVKTLTLTKATDRGLVHLKGLRNLRSLNLAGTPVTDVGLMHLAAVSTLEEIDLSRTKVTNAGLVHLRGLKRLKSLTVYKTQVTYEGIAKLKQALPDVIVVPQIQFRGGITLGLLGVRHHPKRKTLLIRVEYWGKNVASLNFGNPVISVDSRRRRASSPG